MPLPDVSVPDAGPAPYVLASRHPNGATSIATLPRISTGAGSYFPLADISIEIADATAPIGIFGRYNSLTLKLSAEPGSCRIFAQDLAGDKATDVTDRVKCEGKTITLCGKLIKQVGLSAAAPGDLSEPALVLVIKK